MVEGALELSPEDDKCSDRQRKGLRSGKTVALEQEGPGTHVSGLQLR